MKTGAAAGMDTAGALWGFRDRRELEANYAVYLLEKPMDLLKIVECGDGGLLIIGNGISFVAAIFMVASCVVKRKRTIFLCPFLECALLTVASVFFGALAGMTTLVLSAIRNLLVANDRYTKSMMIVFLILTIVAGILANTRGLVGLLPVFTTVEYTICCHYIVGEKATKCNLCECSAMGDLLVFDL